MTMTRTPRKPRGVQRAAQYAAPSVNDAHRAIAHGHKSLAEISDMMREAQGESLFDSARFSDELPEIRPLPPVGFLEMRVGIFSYGSLLGLTLTLGVMAGVPLGVLLHGSAIHGAVSTVLPFL